VVESEGRRPVAAGPQTPPTVFFYSVPALAGPTHQTNKNSPCHGRGEAWSPWRPGQGGPPVQWGGGGEGTEKRVWRKRVCCESPETRAAARQGAPAACRQHGRLRDPAPLQKDVSYFVLCSGGRVQARARGVPDAKIAAATTHASRRHKGTPHACAQDLAAGEARRHGVCALGQPLARHNQARTWTERRLLVVCMAGQVACEKGGACAGNVEETSLLCCDVGK